MKKVHKTLKCCCQAQAGDAITMFQSSILCSNIKILVVNWKDNDVLMSLENFLLLRIYLYSPNNNNLFLYIV